MSNLLNMKIGTAETTDMRQSYEIASANGAITIQPYGMKTVFITKAGVCAMTLAAPATTQDGVVIRFVSTTAQAHTLTVATIGVNAGGTASDVGTFGAAIGNGCAVQAYNGNWYVIGNTNVTFA